MTRPFRSRSARWPVKPAACPKSLRRKKALASSEERSDRFPTGAYSYFSAPWHFLYFFPLPQGQGSLRPTFSPVRRCAGWLASPPPDRLAASSSRTFLRWNSFSSASMVVEGCRVEIEISLGAASSVSGCAALATGGALGTARRTSGAAGTLLLVAP